MFLVVIRPAPVVSGAGRLNKTSNSLLLTTQPSEFYNINSGPWLDFQIRRHYSVERRRGRSVVPVAGGLSPVLPPKEPLLPPLISLSRRWAVSLAFSLTASS